MDDSSGGGSRGYSEAGRPPPLGAAAGGAWFEIGGVGILANFAVAKVVVFAIPLLLAAISVPRVYGAIEVAYAAGLMLASLPLLAPLHGMSHQYFVGEQRVVRDQATALVLVACASSLVAISLAGLAGASMMVLLTIGLAGVTAIQITAAFLLRMRERSYLVAWSDGFTMLTLAAIITLTARLAADDILFLLVAALVFISLTATIVAAVILIRAVEPGLRQRLAIAARVGAPMYGYAIFNIWAGASGRVLIGFLSLADVAAYGVAFRLAGAALLAHRLTITVLWSRLYTASPTAADRMLAFQVVLTAVIAAAVSLGGPWLLDSLDLLALDASGARAAEAVLPIVALQIFFFAAQSLLQARINRTGSAGKSLLPMAAITASGLILILSAGLLGAGIEALCWLLALYCAAFFFGAVMVLARNAAPHPRVTGAGAVGGVVLTVIALG